MLVSTKGIVLHSTKYADTSVIVKIFTREFGNQSFIVKGAFRKNNKFHVSTFAPLAILEISYDDSSRSSLKFLRDVTPIALNNDLFFNPVKSSIIMFYNEILYKLILDIGQDVELYDFIENELQNLNTLPENNVAVLPIVFLLRLSKIMGYYPEDNYSNQNCCFSLIESRFLPNFAGAEMVVSPESSYWLHNFLSSDAVGNVPRHIRTDILKSLVTYFQLHNEHLRKIDSIDVLGVVLH